MDGVHQLLAYAVVAATVVGVVQSLLLIGWQRDDVLASERLQAAVVSLVIVGAASGIILLAMGYRPADPLHLLYAAVAVVVIPVARSFAGRTLERRTALLLLAALIVLGALTYRLFTTG